MNNASITNLRSTAIDMESKKNAYLVLTGTNSVKDGTTADDSHKGAIYSKGKVQRISTKQIHRQIILFYFCIFLVDYAVV